MPDHDEAREQAQQAKYRWGLEHRATAADGFYAGWDARGQLDEAALEEERGKFQRETLRTSELTALLLRVEKLHSDRGHEPGAWSRGCPDCALVAEARALIATPINLRALAGPSEEAESA